MDKTLEEIQAGELWGTLYIGAKMRGNTTEDATAYADSIAWKVINR